MPLKCQLSVCACIALRMKYSSAHRNSSRPPCCAERRKYGASLPSLPGGLAHLLFVRLTDVFQTMLSRVPNSQQSEKLPGVDGSMLGGGARWSGWGPRGPAGPAHIAQQLFWWLQQPHKYEYRQETCASYSVKIRVCHPATHFRELPPPLSGCICLSQSTSEVILRCVWLNRPTDFIS